MGVIFFKRYFDMFSKFTLTSILAVKGKEANCPR
jgi:hypothetical protein